MSDVWVYESPRVFRHGNEMFLVTRRDINGPYDWGRGTPVGDLPYDVQKGLYLSSYSLRPHTTSIWKINKNTLTLEFVTDLFGVLSISVYSSPPPPLSD